MTTIQLFLLTGLFFAALLTIFITRSQLLGRLFFISQFIIGGIFVLFPEMTTRIAGCLGVGRGTDLILYFLVLIFYFTALLFIRRFRMLEKRETEIIRALAIRQAIAPVKEETPFEKEVKL